MDIIYIYIDSRYQFFFPQSILHFICVNLLFNSKLKYTEKKVPRIGVIAKYLLFFISDTNTSREYAIPNDFSTLPAKSSVIVNFPPPPPPPRYTPTEGSFPESQHYASTDIAGPGHTASMYPSIAGVSGSTLYSHGATLPFHTISHTVPVPHATHEISPQDDISALEFPRENLKFIDKLGEGQFGEVSIQNRHVYYVFHIK